MPGSRGPARRAAQQIRKSGRSKVTKTIEGQLMVGLLGTVKILALTQSGPLEGFEQRSCLI